LTPPRTDNNSSGHTPAARRRSAGGRLPPAAQPRRPRPRAGELETGGRKLGARRRWSYSGSSTGRRRPAGGGHGGGRRVAGVVEAGGRRAGRRRICTSPSARPAEAASALHPTGGGGQRSSVKVGMVGRSDGRRYSRRSWPEPGAGRRGSFARSQRGGGRRGAAWCMLMDKAGLRWR
jgi:hypothetical protein